MDTKRKIKAPVNELTVTIGGNSYKIKMPNNGQFIDIESAKLRMTDGTHAKMAEGALPSQYAYFLTSVLATLSVLVPELSKDAMLSLTDMTPIQSKEITKLYTERIFPWLQDIRAVANDEVEIEDAI